MTLATSKGNIHAHLKHGMGDLSASTSVGDILLDATELDSPSRVDLAVSKGKAEAHLVWDYIQHIMQEWHPPC